MSFGPRNSQEKIAVWTALLLSKAACLSSAQNFTTQIAGSDPFGVNGPLPFGQALEFVATGGIKGGFNTGVGLNSSYNSNFFQSENNPESEVTMSLIPTLGYTTDPEGGARTVITASYLPVANAYLNNSNLNRVDQSGSVSIVVSGSRTTISAFAGYVQQSGVDRFAGGDFVTGSALSVGLRGTYQLAPRTSVFASISPSLVEYSNSPVPGFGGYSANVGGNWAATELFSFGPTLSYSSTTSDTSGTLDSWGISAQASYKATDRISVSGSIGTQYTQGSRDSESGNFNLTGSLNASYQINELWSWSSSVQSGIVPSPTQTNYVINSWSISSGLNRSLLIGSLGVGLNMEFSNFERVGNAGSSQDPDQNFGASLSYGRPLFSDRLGFTSSLLYVFNNGQSDWSQIQLNAGLNLAF